MAKTDLILHKETMSSLEISELTGKQHAHVMRDIRALLGQGVSQSNFGLSSYKQSQPNGGYKDVACYELTKKGCLILASGYDALLREKIINRWEELETKLQEMSSPSYMIADPIKRAEKWIEEQKQLKRLAAENEKQAEQIAQDAPRVLFSKAVETAKRSCLIAELAKILRQNGVNIGQNRLFDWMRKNGYLCSKGQYYNQPTQRAQELGLFEIKQTAINKPDGSTLVSTTTKVTGKGQIYFVDKFLNEVNAGRAAV